MAETWFQVVKRGSGEELGPARELLSEALGDKRKLVFPEVAEIARVKRKQGRGAPAADVVSSHARGALFPQRPSRPQAIRAPR